jgi:exodeoxyribonuclease VII large subunit
MNTPDTLELDFAEKTILSVSALNREARLLIESGLGIVWVEGEISNFSRPASGHMYWSLKDARAQVRCAMFRQANRSLGFTPDNGLQVLIRVRVSIYEARGDYQLIVDQMEPAGEGILRRRFEELKRKLAAEGLFDADRKLPLPALPQRIGVVTSPTGAALRDVLIALKRRFPAVNVLIYPTSVQGDGAADEICRALRLADSRGECDLLILTRGGGSLEDLWPFIEEAVARAIAAVRIPVISGVGHEIDFTIADFVADVRAPTPSQAAELAVPDRNEFDARLRGISEHLRRFVNRRLSTEQQRINVIAHRLQRMHPGVVLRAHQQRLDELDVRLMRGLRHAITGLRLRLGQAAARIAASNPRHQLAAARTRCSRAAEQLEGATRKTIEKLTVRTSLAERALRSLSPLATLERGYAIVAREDDRSIVTDAAAVGTGTAVAVQLARGSLTAVVSRSIPSADE